MPRSLPAAVYWRRRSAVVLAAAALAFAVIGGISHLVDGRRGTGGAADASPQRVESPPPTRPTPAEPASPSTTTVTGRFTVAPGGTGVVGTGKTFRYRVETEEGTGVAAATFARSVDAILGDRRGWTTADKISLQRVADGPADFAVKLATPDTTDRLCLPLDTHGDVSCGHNAMAVVNLTRWQTGARASGLGLADYRAYVVLHEFGHLLGHRHESCAGPGARATTMMQQTYSIGACTPNPWPTPDA